MLGCGQYDTTVSYAGLWPVWYYELSVMLGCGQYDTNVSVIVLALLIGLILPYELDMMILFILIFGVLHVLRQCNACVRNAQK